jgi:hypothetical protein
MINKKKKSLFFETPYYGARRAEEREIANSGQRRW